MSLKYILDQILIRQNGSRDIYIYRRDIYLYRRLIAKLCMAERLIQIAARWVNASNISTFVLGEL